MLNCLKRRHTLFSFVFIKYFSLTKRSYRCKCGAVCGLGSAVAATCVASIKQEHSTDASNKLRGFFFFPCVGLKTKQKNRVVDKLNFRALQMFEFIKDRISILRLPSCNTVRAPLTNLEPGRAIFGTREPRR